jgi:hypothetical protein
MSLCVSGDGGLGESAKESEQHVVQPGQATLVHINDIRSTRKWKRSRLLPSQRCKKQSKDSSRRITQRRPVSNLNADL